MKRFFAWLGVLSGLLAQTSFFSHVAHGKVEKAPASLKLLEKALLLANTKNNFKALDQVGELDPFFDHAQGVLGRHERDLARVALEKRQFSGAIRLAKLARDRLVKIQALYSGGPWVRMFANEVGQLELIEARALHSKRQMAKARVLYERAFDRIALALVSWQDLSAYFESCGDWQKLAPTDSCTLWGRKLLAIFPKASPERRELEGRFKAVIETLEITPASQSTGRVQQVYKVTDADAEAWDEILPRIQERNLRWASPLFEKFLEKFPRSQFRQRARYWWALSLLESGPDKKAFSLLEQVARESPLSYYGLLSARQLNRNPDEFLSSEIPREEPRDPRLHPSELAALERAEILLKHKLTSLAELELKEIRVRDALDSNFLVYLARLHQAAKSHLGAFTVVTELVARGAPAAATQWAAEIVFPVEHWEVIQQAAQAKQLDPIWVLSLMKQESAFEDSAQSGVGAVGLMQVMPATALDVDPGVLRLELALPARNVAIGTGYMALLARRFKGNLALATASYNAGPQAVERWVREKGPYPGLVEFIEAIPYRETRDYVGSIVRNYFWYTRKLKPEPSSVPDKEVEYFWKVTPQNGNA